MTELEQVCQRVLALIGDRGEAQTTAVVGPDALTRFANSVIHQNVAEDGMTVQVKVVVDGRAATMATTVTDDEGLRRLVDRALAAASLRPSDPDWPGMAPPAPLASGEHWDDTTAEATPGERAELVQQFISAAPGASRAAGYCATRGRRAAFANTAGQQFTTRAAVATIDGIHRLDGQDGSGRATATRLGDVDARSAGRCAAEKASRGIEPIAIEPGRYEVVLEPACVADIVGFLSAFGFNAKAHDQGVSFVHLGEQQFDRSVSLWDDATDPRSSGWLFDEEGTPKRRVELVRDGVSVALAHDRRSARRAGTETTGHAAAEAYIAGPYPQHVFFGEGEKTRAELIAEVERGVLVTDFWYTRILDPKTEVVTGLTRNGVFLIERGELTKPVANLRFTQSYVAALAPGNVKGIGRDGQLVGQSHVPSLHLASWNFTGGGEG